MLSQYQTKKVSVTLVHQLNESSLDRLEFVLKCHIILGVSKWHSFSDEKTNFELNELVLLNNSLSRNLQQDPCFRLNWFLRGKIFFVSAYVMMMQDLTDACKAKVR